MLEGPGSVSHAQALGKAKAEYRKYQVQTIAPVEQAYLETVKSLEKEAKNVPKNKFSDAGTASRLPVFPDYYAEVVDRVA